MFSLFIIFVLCCCWGDVVYTGVGEEIRDVWNALRLEGSTGRYGSCSSS